MNHQGAQLSQPHLNLPGLTSGTLSMLFPPSEYPPVPPSGPVLCHQNPYYFSLCFYHILTALSSPNLSSPSFSYASPNHPRLSFSLLECELSEAGPDTVLVTLLLQCHLVHNHAQKSKVNVELAPLPLSFSVAKSLLCL